MSVTNIREETLDHQLLVPPQLEGRKRNRGIWTEPNGPVKNSDLQSPARNGTEGDWIQPQPEPT